MRIFCAPPMACLTENLWDILFLPWLSPYNGWLMGGSPSQRDTRRNRATTQLKFWALTNCGSPYTVVLYTWGAFRSVAAYRKGTVVANENSKGGIFGFFLFMYVIQHCFICCPSESTVSEDAGIEPRTVAILAWTARRCNHANISRPLEVTKIIRKGGDLSFVTFWKKGECLDVWHRGCALLCTH